MPKPEFVRTLIMTYFINMYINKYATIRSTQTHTKCKYGYGRTSCAFRDDRAESGDIEGQPEGGHM